MPLHLRRECEYQKGKGSFTRLYVPPATGSDWVQRGEPISLQRKVAGNNQEKHRHREEGNNVNKADSCRHRNAGHSSVPYS